jgi:DNA-binding NtrC family response regulator
MQQAVRKLERIKGLTVENIRLRRQLKKEYGVDRIIGQTEAMARARDLVVRVCRENATVLIEGENGTGKELVAKAIHYNGPRAAEPFVPIDCASIAPESFQAELFGQARETLAGPNQYKLGLLKLAEGGTVYLDEVADIPMEMQVKLLRCLQERSIRPVGSVTEIKVDVRIIAATSRPLEECVRKQEFSRDLFYQLNVVNISLPPLRERREDVQLLLDHFLQARSTGSRRVTEVSQDAMDAILKYHWPGNVRELENMVDRVLALGLSEQIEKEDLPPTLLKAAESPQAALIATDDDLKPLEDVEKEAILRTLARTGGDKMLASQILGIDRSTLYRKLKRF